MALCACMYNRPWIKVVWMKNRRKHPLLQLCQKYRLAECRVQTIAKKLGWFLFVFCNIVIQTKMIHSRRFCAVRTSHNPSNAIICEVDYIYFLYIYISSNCFLPEAGFIKGREYKLVEQLIKCRPKSACILLCFHFDFRFIIFDLPAQLSFVDNVYGMMTTSIIRNVHKYVYIRHLILLNIKFKVGLFNALQVQHRIFN